MWSLNNETEQWNCTNFCKQAAVRQYHPVAGLNEIHTCWDSAVKVDEDGHVAVLAHAAKHFSARQAKTHVDVVPAHRLQSWFILNYQVGLRDYKRVQKSQTP